MDKVAILIDGGFYRRRAHNIYGNKTPNERATELIDYCRKHLGNDNLYRIFYYDCSPMTKKVFHPLTNKTIDFQKSNLYIWMNTFLTILKSKRKTAIRLGQLSDTQACYTLTNTAVKKLCNGSLNVADLQDSDFVLQVSQKGVDMKIGIDIASLAYKKQVSKIILISGDSDFVPAAKLARREGIDFILDPMWAKIKDDLFEHIDGLQSHCPKI
jgi:hypothetical protein